MQAMEIEGGLVHPVEPLQARQVRIIALHVRVQGGHATAVGLLECVHAALGVQPQFFVHADEVGIFRHW